ncbi:MAG: hypothetical protein MUP24_14305 [Gillisia sp.]|nr:hypothetical protein [Gillisia sp.]
MPKVVIPNMTGETKLQVLQLFPTNNLSIRGNLRKEQASIINVKLWITLSISSWTLRVPFPSGFGSSWLLSW